MADPLVRISALRRHGVAFTPAQKALAASLAESGDHVAAHQLISSEIVRQIGEVDRG